MTTLNSIQYQGYHRAQTLTNFLDNNKSIYASFKPFDNEVASFLHNVKQLSVDASLKEKNGKSITIEKRELKQIIARDGAYLCNLVSAYALTKGDRILLNDVLFTYTDIYTLKDCLILGIITRITSIITLLLEDEEFRAYGITAAKLTSLTQKAEKYNRIISKGFILNRASNYASRNITGTLKKISGNIAQFNQLLYFFSDEHPDFVTGFHEACAMSKTGVNVNAIEGTIKEESTGYPVAGITISGEGKNKSAVTDANGYYRLAGIKTGRYKLTITAKGYATEEVTVQVIRGKTIQFNFTMKSTILNLPAEKAA